MQSFLFPREEGSETRSGRYDLQKERRKVMKKIIAFVMLTLVAFALIKSSLYADEAYRVEKGDSLWKIAVKYEVGLSEIKSANPSIKNYDLIYPGQIINIPTVSSSVSSYESEVIRLVNEIRQKNGLAPLIQDWQLSRVARYKSQDMRDLGYFSHTSPIYGSPFNMMKSFGISYKTAGENIAKGYSSPRAVVDAWMNSPGHRANILNSSYTHIGVGYVASGNYWTQMFRS